MGGPAWLWRVFEVDAWLARNGRRVALVTTWLALVGGLCLALVKLCWMRGIP